MHISVALCTYNGARYLSGQLYSIAQQNRLPDELIICDDVSIDNTLEIIESFAKSVPFKIRFHQNDKNLGSTKNFEQAIRLCEGDIIALCDQDDYWYPDKLAVMEDIFNIHEDVGLAFSNADVVDAKQNKLGYTLWDSVRFDSKRQEQLANGDAISALVKRTIVTGAAMAFRTQFRDLVLPISPIYVHDEWIAFLIAVVSKLYMIENPLLQYRQHGANQIGAEKADFSMRMRRTLSNKHDPQIYLSRYEKYHVLYKYLKEKLPDYSSKYAQLDEKAKHLYIRGTLPHQHLKRISPIFNEILTGRYYTYSGSWFSPVIDFIIKH